MTRFVDRGAITAAYVGIGMAVTIAISFLLIIPIEPIVWLLALPSGLLIGYYANQRSNRGAGPWLRLLANGLFAGLVTGLTMAVLLIGVKALFFFADNGYRDPGLGGSLVCSPGAECVYLRYLDLGRGPDLEAVGVTDVGTFTSFYWSQQFQSAALILVLTTLGGLGGAAVYGVTRPRSTAPAAASTPAPVATAPAPEPVPAPEAPEITATVAELLRIGWFADRPDRDPAPLAREIDAAYRDEYGNGIDPADRFSDLLVASRDPSRVWWQDLEADVASGNDVYAATVADWAAISVGAFRPESINGLWATDEGPVTVSMLVDGHPVELHPVVAEDWIDLGILQPINELIGSSGRRFLVVEPFDQTAYILALTDDERRAFEARSWRFVEAAPA